MNKVNVGVVGLGFGKEFASIYCDHPDVDKVAICTRNEETLKSVGDELNIPEELRFLNYDDMVGSDILDAIHNERSCADASDCEGHEFGLF